MKTKYTIGQKVWLIKEGIPTKMKVTRITIYSQKRTSYQLDGNYSYNENCLGGSKEELKNILFN